MVSPRQGAIDHAWTTARPPRVFEGVGVTAGEVIRVVRRARVGAALGLDGIPVCVLQRCIHMLLPWLLRVYSGSLRGGHLSIGMAHSTRYYFTEAKEIELCFTVQLSAN